MNRKGFTLTELLATLVVLGIIMGITLVSTMGGFRNSKDKTEDVFISTIEDALDMYLDSDARNFKINKENPEECQIKKTHGIVNVYKVVDKTFEDVINSRYSPLTESELVNPANKEVKCNTSASVTIYRDDDYVYYYKVSRSSFGCLLNTEGNITNLPGDSECLS